MNASTIEYDRRDCEKTQMELDLLEQEREGLQHLLEHADSDDEHDRYGLALDAVGDAIGRLQSRLYEVGGGEWR